MHEGQIRGRRGSYLPKQRHPVPRTAEETRGALRWEREGAGAIVTEPFRTETSSRGAWHTLGAVQDKDKLLVTVAGWA